jgi:hypothetical protein
MSPQESCQENKMLRLCSAGAGFAALLAMTFLFNPEIAALRSHLSIRG